jgi:hypothetical protein
MGPAGTSSKQGAHDMSDNNMVMAIYNTQRGAEDGLKGVLQSGADMKKRLDVKKVSLLAKGYFPDNEAAGIYNDGDGMKHLGKYGRFWNSIWGIIPNAAAFTIPGTGPVLVAGPFVSWIVDALKRTPSSTRGAIGASLSSIGIPENSILEYEHALKEGKFLFGYYGTAGEVDRAHYILRGTEPAAVDTHSNLAAEPELMAI